MAKTQEPNQKVSTVDETSGLVSTPVSESIKIACVINADTGTTNRQTLTSQKQLIDTYLTGSTINQKHNQSIQYIAGLLNYTTVDTIRVDSGKMRVGVGSYGNIFYCTDKYKPLSKVDWVPLDNDIDLDYKVLWVVVNDIVYYLWADMRSEDDTSFADGASLGNYSTFFNLAAGAPNMERYYTGMIERFFYGLEVQGVTLYDGFNVSRFDNNIVRYSGDNKDASGNPGFYNVTKIKTPAAKLSKYSSSNGYVYPGDEIDIDDQAYALTDTGNSEFNSIGAYAVYKNGQSGDGQIIVNTNETNDYFDTETNTVRMPATEFFARLADKIYSSEISVIKPWGYDSEFNMKFSGVSKITLHGDFYEELYVNDDNKTVVSKDANDVCGAHGFGKYCTDKVEPSYIRIQATNGGVFVFYIGEEGTAGTENTVRYWTANTNGIRDSYEDKWELDYPDYTVYIKLEGNVTGQGALFRIYDLLNQIKAAEVNEDELIKGNIEVDGINSLNSAHTSPIKSANVSAEFSKWINKTSLVYKNNGAEPVITVASYADNEIPVSSGRPNNDFYEFKHEKTSTNKDYATFSSIFFCVDENCYYSGTKPVLKGMYTYINLTKQYINVQEFINKLYSQLKADYTFGKVSYALNGKSYVGFRLSGWHTYDWSGNLSAERNKVQKTESGTYYSYDGETFYTDTTCKIKEPISSYSESRKNKTPLENKVYVNGKQRSVYEYTLTDVYVYNNTDTVQLNCHMDMIEHIDQDAYEDKFVAIGRFLTPGDQFKMSFSNNDDDFETKNLILTYKDSKESTYKISFNPDAVNDYGSSLYYDKVNDGNNANEYFYIYERNIDPDAVEDGGILPDGLTKTFGKELDVIEPDTADYIEAIQKFNNEKYNTNDTKYDIICDSGIADPSFARACSALADEMNAIYPCSFPTKDKDMKDAFYTEASDYKEYRDTVGTDTPRTLFHAPVFKIAAVSTYLNTLPRSFSYIVSRVSAYNSIANEFMGLFGPTNGQIQAGTQPVKFDVDEREDLLDSQINTVITNSNGTYFNNNLTGQTVGSYLSEDQNIYMTNIISHICEQYNPTLYGKQNTPELWSKVISDLTTRINNRMISNKSDKLNGFKIVCNSQLNTREMIEQNTLKYEVWVMYNLTVKYVRAYVCVKRLGSF